MRESGLALEGTIRHRTLGVCGSIRIELDYEPFKFQKRERLEQILNIAVHEAFNVPGAPAGVVLAEIVHFRVIELPERELLSTPEPPQRPKKGPGSKGARESSRKRYLPPEFGENGTLPPECGPD